MYAKGMTTRQISDTLMDIYGFEASEGFISDVTDKLLPQIEEWQNRPLDELYPVLFIDAIRYSVRDEWLLLKPTEAEQHDILELLHRRRKKSSTIFCSQYDPSGWYDQLGGDDSPLAEAILDSIKHDAYKINIVPTDPSNYRSMREVYGLDPTLSE